MTDIYLAISVSTHNGDDTPQNDTDVSHVVRDTWSTLTASPSWGSLAKPKTEEQ